MNRRTLEIIISDLKSKICYIETGKPTIRGFEADQFGEKRKPLGPEQYKMISDREAIIAYFEELLRKCP